MLKMKKILSIMVALALIVSSLSIMMAVSVSADAPVIWDGSSSDSSLEGSGTSADPYRISTPAEFNYAMHHSTHSVYYKLTADIYLNDITKINWDTGAAVSGYTPNTWTSTNGIGGYFDGNGHVVYGMYINTNPSDYSEKNSGGAKVGYGLIGNNYNGKILQFDNFGLDYIFINAAHEVSPFVPNQNGGTINFNSCFVGENVHLEGYAVGGFVGYGSNSIITILDSYCLIPTANVTNHDGKLYGAFLGNTWNGSNKPTIQYDFCVGRLYGNSNPNSTNYSYATVQKASGWGTIITEQQMKGADALTNMSGLHTEKFVTTDSFPQLKIFVSTPLTFHKTPSTSEVIYVNGEETIADLDVPTIPGYSFGGFYYDASYTQAATSADLLSAHSDVYVKWTLNAEGDVWSGTKEAPMYGSGTANDPYLIYTAEEFAYAVTSYQDSAHPYFELKRDIYLNDVSDSNWKSNSPTAWYNSGATAFVGTLDGDNHIVYGMYRNSVGSGNTSLIPKFQGGTVKNIGVKDAYLNANNVGGIFTASTWYGETVYVDNCFVDSDVTLIGSNYAAGIVSHVSKSGSSYQITNCYSLAETISTHATQAAGGIIGDAYSISSCKIENCYSLLSISGRSSASGITPKDCYHINTTGVTWNKTTDMIAADMQGAFALVKMPGLGDAFAATLNGYPILASFSSDAIVNYHITPDTATPVSVPAATTFADVPRSSVKGYSFGGFYFDANYTSAAGNAALVSSCSDFYAKWTPNVNNNDPWNGTKIAPLLGAGTEQNPYQIYTPEELAYAVTSGTDGDYYQLKKNIYVNDVTGAWTENSPTAWMDASETAFAGTLDGNGKIVYGLYYSGSGNVSLIPKFEGGTVKNLGIKNSYLSGNNVGGIFTNVADKVDDFTIENCFIGSDVTLIGSNFAGGMISHYYGTGGNAPGLTVKNSYSLASVTNTGSGNAAGIIGDQWNVSTLYIVNCYANMSLSGRGTVTNMTRTAGKYSYEVNTTGVDWSSKNIVALSASAMQGRDVFSNSSKMPNLNADGVYMLTDGYPELTAFRSGVAANVNAFCVIKGDDKKAYTVYSDTLVSELQAPTRFGYDFMGFYTDAALTIPLAGSELVADHAQFYSAWKLSDITTFTDDFDDNVITFTDVDLEAKASDKIDESGATNYKGSNISTGATFAGANGAFSQYDAVVTSGGRVGNCVKFDFAAGYKNRWPAAFLLYDANGDAFVPQPNSRYRITLKYKVNKTAESGDYAKDLDIVLRSVSKNGKADPGKDITIDDQSTSVYEIGNGVYQYGAFNEEHIKRGAETGGWVSEDLIFTTGSSTTALFIALVATHDNANYFAKDLDVRVDDIVVQSCSIPEDLEPGDTNGDGFVDIIDLVRIKKMAAGTIAFTWGANLTNDYTPASAADTAALVNALLAREATSDIVTSKMGRTLVWSDEFDGDSLDYGNWGYRQTMKNSSETSSDLIYDNTRSHADVSDGSLNLKINKTASGKYVLAQGLSTRGKMSFNHGYLEIRAKLPMGQGMWPSLWMQAYGAYGFERDVDYNPEIDIFEAFSSSDTIKFNLIKHYPGGDNDMLDSSKNNLRYTNAALGDGNFHTYGFEWTATEMKLYFDDVLYTTIELSDSSSSSLWSWWHKDNGFFNKSGETNHFADTFFSININDEIFNSAYTSSSEGDWASSYTIQNNSALPNYVIDYVRLYQKSGEHMSLDQQTLAR